MKKVFKVFSITCFMVLLLTGCTTHKSYTYSVATGDSIKVELDTSDGYDLSSNLPFTISKDDKILSQGTFIQGSYYDQYVNVAKTDPLAKVIDTGSDSNIEYVFYSYNDSEWNYVVKVKNSNTALLIGNPNSKEEAEKCFSLLSFSLAK